MNKITEEIKLLLNVMETSELLNDEDKKILITYESLKLDLRLNEKKFDKLVNENELQDNLISDLKKRENEILNELNKNSYELKQDKNEENDDIKRNIIKLQEDNKNLEKIETNEKINLETNESTNNKNYLFHDCSDEFFEKHLYERNISVSKINFSFSKYLKKKKLCLESSILDTPQNEEISNLFIIILNRCDSIEFDLSSLDEKFKNSFKFFYVT